MYRDAVESVVMNADDAADFALDCEFDNLMLVDEICARVDRELEPVLHFCDTLEVYCNLPVIY